MFNPPPPERLAQHGRVATLGMFIIDHFEVHDTAGNLVPVDEEAMGGGGLYAMTAARLFLPPSHVSFIVDCGTDFPPRFRSELEALGIARFRSREGLTTRALNIYSGHSIGEGHQSFQYLSPRINITPADYLSGPFGDKNTEWIHVVCDTSRADSILAQADAFSSEGWKGNMVWEPLIRSNVQEQADTWTLHAALQYSGCPNELELQTILNSATADVQTNAGAFRDLCLASKGESPAIVVRAGAQGAFVMSQHWTGWIPAYWQPSEASHVLDVTGGGNAFIGGLIAGLLLTDDYRAAAIFASVAASFAIEQRGIPSLTVPDGNEMWNGVSAWSRLQDMVNRMDQTRQHKKET